MSKKSSSPLRKLKDAIKNTEYEGVRIEKVDPGMFELWRGSIASGGYFICLVGYRFGKWGATYNMEPGKERAIFDNPVSAIRSFIKGDSDA